MVNVTEQTSMRDAFFSRLFELAKEDRRIFLISADMGAPAMDRFKTDLQGQYVDGGIAEQNAISFAAGLAHSGRKPYVYAIAPFVVNRIHEFIKLDLGLMKFPITIIGMGTGYSYEDSGPTHHLVEDISMMTPIPHLEIYSPSDSVLAAHCADLTARTDAPKYLRLERRTQQIKYPNSSYDDFLKGYAIIKGTQSPHKLALVATGNTVDMAKDISQQLLTDRAGDVDVIDLYRLKPISDEFKDILRRYSGIVSVEEHFLRGGLGSMIAEIITDNDLQVRLRRVGVENRYNYEYGDRRYIRKKMGLTEQKVVDALDSLLK